MNLDLNLRRNLPLAGIIAFSLCSVWSLYQLLIGHARHDTYLFAIPAVLIELVTAWAVYQCVAMARQVLKSNISDQDRRFYRLMLIMFVAVAIPTLGASVWANSIEFGNVLLGFLFPIGSIGCAVGVALPDVMGEYQETRRREKERDSRAKAERKQRRAEERRLKAELGQRGWQITCIIHAEPTLNQAEIAQKAGIARQTVDYHIRNLIEKGIIGTNGGQGYEVLVDLPKR